uniref:Transcriptional regulator, AraC family n=1 Tax=Caulobacter sp. (strain K31) TaxID=366602 RepID=B0T993_CAUSK
MPPRTITLLAAPGVQLLDVAGPLDVFAEANLQAGETVYRPRVVGLRPGPIASSSGVRLLPDTLVGEPISLRSDTLLVAGAPHAPDLVLSDAEKAWLRLAAGKARRHGSVCSGAFLLAQAGLLAGRRVTTHWAVAERLAAAWPDIVVDADALYVRDGRLRTAAGVTAGLDLALALVEEDLGRDVAVKVAAQLVMFFRRPGGQLQFSRRGELAPQGRSALQEVQRWISAHPQEDHAVAKLAARAGLSPRHFARLFVEEIGVTPAAFVEAARVAAARRMLEDGGEAPKQVAVLCGFADADVLRRAFVRHVGVTPAEFRRRHGASARQEPTA